MIIYSDCGNHNSRQMIIYSDFHKDNSRQMIIYSNCGNHNSRQMIIYIKDDTVSGVYDTVYLRKKVPKLKSP